MSAEYQKNQKDESAVAKLELTDISENVESSQDPVCAMTCSVGFVNILVRSKKLCEGIEEMDKEIGMLRLEAIHRMEAEINVMSFKAIDSKDMECNVIILARAFLYLASSYELILKSDAFCTEENSLYCSRKSNCLIKCLELLRGKELKRAAILIAMNVYSKLASDMTFDNIDEVLGFANNATEVYIAYTKKSNEYPAPIDISTMLGFEPEKDFRLLLEHTYLQCVYNICELRNKHENLHTIVTHMHQSLKNILSFKNNSNLFKDKNYIFWIKNLGILSDYFIKYNRLTEARNHLATADFLSQELFIIIHAEDNPENALLYNDYKKAVEVITEKWIEYGLKLLHLSIEKLLQRLHDDDCKSSDTKLESSKSEKQFNELLLLFDTEKDLEEFAPITDQYVLCYDDAEKVFKTMMDWYNKLWLDDMSENYKSYPKYIYNISSAIKCIIFYNTKFYAKIKLLGQRVNILEMFLQKLNPETELNICQQVSIELAIVFSNVLNILYMQEILEDHEPNSTITNYLVQCSVHYFQWYCNIKNKPSNLVFVHDTKIWQLLFL